VSLIAEHSFTWSRVDAELRQLFPLARTVIVHADTSDELARQRFIARERASGRTRPDLLAKLIATMEHGTYHWRQHDPPDLGVPVLRVDTTDGCMPDLQSTIAFCRTGQLPRQTNQPPR
jgi:hypothetical protein